MGDRRGRVRVAAEWEPPEAIWLSWPHHSESWPGRFDEIPKFFAGWVREIAETTPVRILAAADIAKDCQQRVADVVGVEIIDVPTNDCWIRDYGPMFTIEPDGSVSGVDWRYNAWGGKYPPWDLDDAVASAVCRHQNIPFTTSKLCVEGGALEFDGHDRLLTTPGCLLTDTRNPGWTKQQIALELHAQLGVTEIVWLDGGGLVGDDTDGHVDQLARFIDRENAVVSVCDIESDPNHRPLEENYRQMRLWGDATHPRVQTHRLPLPPARSIDGQRVPESYCNFLRLGKERILAPTFNAPSDDHALGLLGEISGADVIGIDCRELAWGLGALHCASRDQPMTVPAETSP